MKFWINLGSLKSSYLLSRYGFDVNVRDNEGYTPLLRIVKDGSIKFCMDIKKLSICAHVSMLLNCGTDRSINIVEQGIEKNAMQISTSPTVQNILKQT